MTESMLTLEELLLIEHLREIPSGAMRDELVALVGDLVDFARDPRCARAQGDGVPCLSSDLDCEECRRVAGVFTHLHRTLHAA